MIPQGWAFRVASCPEAGAGHVMRGLALAKALGRPGLAVLDPGTLWDQAWQDLGFSILHEDSPGSLSRLKQGIAAGHVDVVVFDGYDFDRAAMAEIDRSAMGIEFDDIGRTPAVGIVINPGLGVSNRTYEGSSAFVLCGPRYAPLRPEFADAHDRALARTDLPVGILITFGARDSANASGLALDALKMIRPSLPIHVVLGGSAPHREHVARQCDALGARLHIDCIDMTPLYAEAGLAIGGGGMGLLERLCCGVPSLLIAVAENQRPNVAHAIRLGAAQEAGRLCDLDSFRLATAIEGLLTTPARLAAVRNTGLGLVDGRGAARVMSALAELRASAQ